MTEFTRNTDSEGSLNISPIIAKNKASQMNQQQPPQYRGYISNKTIERANEIDYENKLRDQQVKIINIIL